MKPLEDQNLVDHGHVYIKCSNCLAPLVDVWLIDKELDIRWKLKAECPHCGDYSFVYDIQGRYYLGPGYENMDKNDVEGDKDKIYTTLDTFDNNGSIILIKTKKGLDWNDSSNRKKR